MTKGRENHCTCFWTYRRRFGTRHSRTHRRFG